jgi:hypothetical protein
MICYTAVEFENKWNPVGFECTIYYEQNATTFLKQLTLMYNWKCSDFNTMKEKYIRHGSHAPARVEVSTIKFLSRYL